MDGSPRRELPVGLPDFQPQLPNIPNRSELHKLDEQDHHPLLAARSQLLARHGPGVVELRHALKGKSSHHLREATSRATKNPIQLLLDLVCPKLSAGNFLGFPTKSMTAQHYWFSVYQCPLFDFALSNDEATKVEPSVLAAKSDFSAEC
tara:strand:- start:19034 stop:19480 length:447 start_codon:yes stop_codon:yes gene_type:complete